MTEQELDQLRREKWRLSGPPVRTLDDAREFIESVGFCLMYPLRPPILVPTFIGAWVGSDERLPTWQQAFADQGALAGTADASDAYQSTEREFHREILKIIFDRMFNHKPSVIV